MIAFVLALALAGPIHVHGHATIGPYRIHAGTLASAVRAFGAPASKRAGQGACAVRWPGLTMRFYNLTGLKLCSGGTSFESATLTGSWTFDLGLHRGDSLLRIRTLFPGATKAPGGALWLIRLTSPAIGDYGVSVQVRNGRAANLVVLDPQGGE